MFKPILCLDFDGVLHSYTSGWQGAHIIPDPAVPGAIDFLREASESFQIAIFSSRSNQPDGTRAMTRWLRDQICIAAGTNNIPEADAVWFREIQWPQSKPPAHVTIDDRALTFIGEWPDIKQLLNFKPWNKLKSRM